MNKIVQGLWIGDKLSLMEQLSIQSFLKNQHDYHLYVYNDVKNIPIGTTLMDGNEILPEKSIFTYQQGHGKGSYAGFSNFFRYMLLLQKGGWWVDTDVICLKPFDFTNQYIFGSEYVAPERKKIISSGIIKAPPKSEFALYCWENCQKHDIKQLRWGVTGPALVAEAVEKFQLNNYVKKPEVFSPLYYLDVVELIDAEKNLDEILKNSYGIHMWNEMWRRYQIDKDKKYHQDCFYEKLKSKYL